MGSDAREISEYYDRQEAQDQAERNIAYAADAAGLPVGLYLRLRDKRDELKSEIRKLDKALKRVGVPEAVKAAEGKRKALKDQLAEVEARLGSVKPTNLRDRDIPKKYDQMPKRDRETVKDWMYPDRHKKLYSTGST